MDELRAELMRLLLGSVALFVVACSDGQAATGSAATRSGVIDSIVDPQVAIARFVGSPPHPENLTAGAATPGELTAKLLRALSRHDTAAISSMVISRAEYGYLYYPTSEYSRDPYHLPPDIAWILSSETSAKGARRLLGRLGGRRLELERYECARIEQKGANEIHSECSVTYSRQRAVTETRSLFRAIISRNGVAKFLSYSGDF